MVVISGRIWSVLEPIEAKPEYVIQINRADWIGMDQVGSEILLDYNYLIVPI